MNYVCVNGKIVLANQPVLPAADRSYRYGDGLFETMKVINGKILLAQYHYERLFNGLKLLQFKTPGLFTAKRLTNEVLALCKRNKCEDMARVRLSLSRGVGGLYDESKALHYLVECWPAESSVNQLNKNGLEIDIYPDAEKSCDIFCNLKSANYLPYVMAAQFVKQNKLNDALVLNSKGHIADATIANIFLLKNNLLITPALQEGCVEGVMRRYLLEKLSSSSNLEVREGVVRRNDLENFDEVFLTNAMYGMRWVKRFRDKIYLNTQSKKIYQNHIAPLYS